MPGHLELLIFGLLVAVAMLVGLSRLFRVPYPVFLVIGGLLLSLVPGLPEVELPPNLVFLIFLPPLLYVAAFFSSPLDLKANLRPIGLLSIGLVLITAGCVALVAHLVLGLPWSVAFVLGVIVAPTDPVAVTAIASLLGLPRRIVTVLEGESLINDGVALTLYRTAVAAAVAGTFSLFDAGLQLVLSGIGGVAIGLLVGWVISHVRRQTEDAVLETTIALFTGYAAYLPADELGVSGVLAVVAAGLYLSWRSPEMSSPRNRLQVFEVLWVMGFLLNSVLFILIGLQLHTVLERVSDRSTMTLVLFAALISLAVMAIRALSVFPIAYLPRRLSHHLRQRDPLPSWQELVVVALGGMRGAISLALALSLPLTTQSGASFPERDLIIFLTFGVILVTLVLQGLSLPLLISRLGLGVDAAEEQEMAEARLRAAEAALSRLDELRDEEWVPHTTAERMHEVYEFRRQRFATQLNEQAENGQEGEDYEQHSQAFVHLRRELLAAEREALLKLRDEGRISDEVRGHVERDLDLEEARLELI
jgi:Na+/H+ antiporter